MSAVATRGQLLDGLARLYSHDALLTEPATLAAYQSDALTAFEARPRAVVLPHRQDQVVETVRLCHRLGVPFVARGSGTSLSGGSLPVEDGVVIGLNRLDRILRLDPRLRSCTVEPGIWNLEVTRAASAHGLLYAPDPSSQQICSIGGNVAFNSGGAHCLKYGMTANHVLALKAVLPDGEVVTLGGESLTDRAGEASLESIGPGWTGLFVGSEGLFGIALEVTLRLVPRPERYHTILAAYRSLEDAGNAVSRVIASGLPPGAIEMMDRLAMDAAEAAVHAGYPRDAAAALIVELEGPREEVEAEVPVLERLIEESGAFRVQVARTDEERAAIWKGRKSAFSAVGRLSPDYIVQDGVVPRSKLGAALAEIERLSRAYGIRVANVFHAGDGNLHPLILYDGREPTALQRAEDLAAEILRLCIRLDGSITGEHGVGMEKRAFLPEMFSPADMAAMRRLARSIDPAGIANRGKMLEPEAEAAGMAEASGATPTPVDARRGSHRGTSEDEDLQPLDVAELRAMVRATPRVLPFGARTKPGLSSPPPGARGVDLSALAGIAEYDPDELTITARAGTPLRDVVSTISEHRQYLPFDPPLVDRGATVGGAVAAGLSGSGRWRYGGIRDFVLQVRYVDGDGTLVRGGAKVVKNAAGFDLPRLMAGSLGRLGILTEVTLKVLPAPEAHATLLAGFGTLEAAIDAMTRLSTAPLELEALDLLPGAAGGDGQAAASTLALRLGGLAAALEGRLSRLAGLVERLAPGTTVETVRDDPEARLWRAASEFGWVPDGWALLAIPTTPGRVGGLEHAFGESRAGRRYCAAGNLLYLAWPSPELEALEPRLAALGHGALTIWGPHGRPLIGVAGHVFGRRVKAALDPTRHFPDVDEV